MLPRALIRRTAFVAIVTIACGGCASIISGRRSDITFETYPANAHVTIHDDRGKPVASFDTPSTANLKRQGRYFLPARYTATITAPGYQTAQIPIGSTLNPWLLGNVIIGGVPGLVIDSATGAVWKPKRSEIHHHLASLEEPSTGHFFSSDASQQQEESSTVEMAHHEEELEKRLSR